MLLAGNRYFPAIYVVKRHIAQDKTLTAHLLGFSVESLSSAQISGAIRSPLFTLVWSIMNFFCRASRFHSSLLLGYSVCLLREFEEMRPLSSSGDGVSFPPLFAESRAKGKFEFYFISKSLRFSRFLYFPIYFH